MVDQIDIQERRRHEEAAKETSYTGPNGPRQDLISLHTPTGELWFLCVCFWHVCPTCGTLSTPRIPVSWSMRLDKYKDCVAPVHTLNLWLRVSEFWPYRYISSVQRISPATWFMTTAACRYQQRNTKMTATSRILHGKCASPMHR